MDKLFEQIEKFYLKKEATLRVCFRNGLSLSIFWGFGSYSSSGGLGSAPLGYFDLLMGKLEQSRTDDPEDVELAVMIEAGGFYPHKLSFSDEDDDVVGRVAVERLPGIMKEVASVKKPWRFSFTDSGTDAVN